MKTAIAIVICFLVMGQTELLAQTGLGSGFQPPQSVDGTKSGPLDPSATDPAEQKQEKTAGNQAAQVDALYRELDNLIPKKIEDHPEMKQMVQDVITAFQLKNGTRVVEILKQLAAKDSDLPPTELLLAGLSFAIQDSNTGKALLERSAISSPDSPANYTAFARLAINEGRLTDAGALLEKAERTLANSKLSESAKEFYRVAIVDSQTDVAMRQQRFEDAKTLLAKLREMRANNSKMLMLSAELEFKLGNIPETLKYLTQLKEIQPNTRVPKTIVASWFQRSGKKAEAERWFNEAAEENPKNPQVLLEFANWSINTGNLPAASTAIKEAEEASGESPFSMNLKARIAFSKESYGIAESHYETLNQSQKGNFDVSNMYVLCLIESEDKSKHTQAKNMAIANFRALPNNLVAQATLGYIHLKMGELEQAKSVLARAAQSRGTSPEIDYFLGSLLVKMDRKDDAKTTLRGALLFDGFFLYRSRAERLLAELNKADLPFPAVNNK